MKTKKILIFALIAVLALSMVFSTACGKDKEEDTGDNTGDASGITSTEKFEFSLSIHDPAESSNGKYLQSWADEVNAATNGNVTITIYPSEQLAKSGEVAQSVKDGAVDIGWVFTTFYPGQFPLTDVSTVPFAGFGDPVATTNTLWDLYDKYPELQAEWGDFQLIKLYGNPGMIFAGAEKEIKVPADIKGLSLRTPAGLVTQFVKAAGGNPVPMGPPDIQENIGKKVLQGFIFEPAGITNFKLQDVTKYFTDFPIYDGAFGLVFNKDKWASLPDDYKAAIEKTMGREGSLSAAQNFKDAATAAHDTIASKATWVTLTDAEKKEWTDLAKPIQASYTDTIKDKISDPQAYFDDALATIAKYNK